MTDKQILNLAQAELRAVYKRLGINGSNVLTLIDEALRQPLVSGMLCGSFDPDNKTSSATKCKCGREKWEHPKPRN